MRYSLEELREYRDLLREIQSLEEGMPSLNLKEEVGSPVHTTSYWTDERRAQAVENGKKAWTEERRREHSERMRGNTRAKKQDDLLDIALQPLPEGATGRRRLQRDYRCSVCNGIGHNAATCSTLDYPQDPLWEAIE